MDEEARKALCAALGLDEETTSEDAVDAAKALAGRIDELEKSLATAKAEAEQAKATAAASGAGGDDAAETLKAELGKVQGELDKVQKECASLRSDRAREKAEDAVDAAIEAGKISPAQRDWAVGYAAREPAEFASFVEKQPVIVDGRRIVPAKKEPGAALEREEVALAHSMGLDPEKVKETRDRLAREEEEIG